MNDNNQQAAREWMSSDSLRPWVRNGLVHRANELRKLEVRIRKAYTKEYMGAPCAYLAEAYAEAAKAFESRIAEIDAAPPRPTQEIGPND